MTILFYYQSLSYCQVKFYFKNRRTKNVLQAKVETRPQPAAGIAPALIIVIVVGIAVPPIGDGVVAVVVATTTTTTTTTAAAPCPRVVT
jgi:hypothetical protein